MTTLASGTGHTQRPTHIVCRFLAELDARLASLLPTRPASFSPKYAQTVDALADRPPEVVTAAYAEAVRQRAEHGYVDVTTVEKLDAAEWAVVRMMGARTARRALSGLTSLRPLVGEQTLTRVLDRLEVRR